MGLLSVLLMSLPSLGTAEELSERVVRNEEDLAPDVRRALEGWPDEIDSECRERLHAFRVEGCCTP